jgi:hypothetical protein
VGRKPLGSGPTGNIDFHVTAIESTSPQHFILRVEERKIMENSMGQEVTQLRWRLATIDEAKDVACWNAHRPKRGDLPDFHNP